LLHVYAKLGVNDRAAAVAAAYERGLLTPGGGD
jgi:DNA-binding CsgD family transcriptional regulator